MNRRRRAPASHVQDAFGVARGSLEPLPGGQEMTWRAGDLVLKPGVEERFQAWLADLVARVDPGGRFRLAAPVAGADGRWVVGGWTATRWLSGRAHPGEVDALLDVSADLHRALADADVPWPAFLRGRTDRWAVADRVAWREEAMPRYVAGGAATGLLAQLAALLDGPAGGGPPQLVHGDLAGNVLFSADDDGLPPAVIDLSPYRRPAGYAAAVVVVDAVTWHGAELCHARRFADEVDCGRELLARAVAFRVLVDPTEAVAHRPVAEVALGRPLP